MGAIFDQYHDQGVMILSIGLWENQADCAYWKHYHRLNFPVLSDENGRVWDDFSMGGVPHLTVIDCNHTVLYTEAGFNEQEILDHLIPELETSIAIQVLPTGDTETFNQSVPVQAEFPQGTAFLTGYPSVFWSVDGIAFTDITMEPALGNVYTANVPGSAVETEVYYYFDLRSDFGCNRLVPHNAPSTFFQFRIGPDHTPPVLDHTYREQIAENELPFTVTASITDNLGILTARLEYSINGSDYQTIQMNGNGSNYTGVITADLSIDDVVSYRIIATDASQAGNQQSFPASGMLSTTVTHRLPALVIDRDFRHHSGPIIYNDINDMGIYVDYTTEIPLELHPYQAVFICLGVRGSGYTQLTVDEVDILESYLFSGGSAYLESSRAWTDLTSLLEPLFHIAPNGMSNQMIQSVIGYPGTFAQDLVMQHPDDSIYYSNNDQMMPSPDTTAFLRTADPAFPVGMLYENATYKTIGMSVIYGGLAQANTDGQPQELLSEMLTFMEVIENVETPTPSPTPTPTPVIPTPTPNPDAKAEICLNETLFTSGDLFELDLRISNTIETREIDLYLVLDIQGLMYFFWPDWTQTPGFQHRTVEYGSDIVEPILTFTWPEGTGSANDLRFWSVMLTADTGMIFGDYDRVDWHYN